MNTKKIYLYVPYKYKDNAKKKGAKWDNERKQWYSIQSLCNHQYLVDLYHECNFYYGSYVRKTIITEEQRKEQNI